MIKLHRILLAGAMLALATSTSMADALGAGSLSAGTSGLVTATPSDLLSTSLEIDSAYTLTGADSLSSVAGVSGVSTLSLSPGASSFVVTLGDFTFTATEIEYSSASPIAGIKVLAGKLVGLITLNGVETAATGSFSYNQIGNVISGGFTLEVAAVPEPSSVALAGLGLAAAGMFGLRKRLAK